MPQTKRTAQQKRRSKVVLALGAAGLSLSLASSASAAIGGMNGASSAPVCGFGCGGCGCACGSDLYNQHTPPALGNPVDSPPRPIRRAHKHKSHSATR
jgi:anaerobic selenocysteine-containing dehydrogenase